MQKFNIYDDIKYSEEKIQITPMFESDASKEIRIVFTKDQVMKDHKTNFPITVEIFEGEIDFGVDNQIYNLTKGEIVSLEASIVHNLRAKEDSIVRLTLSKKEHKFYIVIDSEMYFLKYSHITLVYPLSTTNNIKIIKNLYKDLTLGYILEITKSNINQSNNFYFNCFLIILLKNVSIYLLGITIH